MSQKLRYLGAAVGALAAPRLLWRLAAWVCAAVASGGCSIATWFPMPTGGSDYGVIAVPLTVKSFNCAPLGPIHPGDKLTFTAEIEPVASAQISVNVISDQVPHLNTILHDNGVDPDATAGDHVFTGQGVWEEEYGTGVFTLRLWASGMKQGEWASGQAQRNIQVEP